MLCRLCRRSIYDDEENVQGNFQMSLSEILVDADSSDNDDDDDDSSIFTDSDFETTPAQDQSQDQEEEEKPSEASTPPLFEAPIPLDDCPICFESLKMIDFTVTKCGHTFHSSCVFRCLEQNLDCPMCRTPLIVLQEEPDDEDADEDEYEDEDADEDEDEDAEEEEDDDETDNPNLTMEQLAEKLQNMGYTPADFLSIYIGKGLKTRDPTRQTHEFLTTLNDKIDDIIEGRITLSDRDQRTYAQVTSRN
jgi:hypothetical protein